MTNRRIIISEDQFIDLGKAASALRFLAGSGGMGDVVDQARKEVLRVSESLSAIECRAFPIKDDSSGQEKTDAGGSTNRFLKWTKSLGNLVAVSEKRRPDGSAFGYVVTQSGDQWSARGSWHSEAFIGHSGSLLECLKACQMHNDALKAAGDV